MIDGLPANAGLLRASLVVGALLLLLLAQTLRPRRNRPSTLARRLRNVGMSVIAALAIHLAMPLAAVGFAAMVSDRHLGLLHWLDWPPTVEFAIGLVALDFAIYWQHRWMHGIPLLWRIHRLHHSDTNFEVTLGLRFHPFEIMVSLFYKCLVIVVLGASPLIVLAYEILLTVFSLFSHADAALPAGLDRRLRWFVITPDWHRVHHSVHPAETDSNYGNMLSVWDRLFGSYISQPRDGHQTMQIGLKQFPDGVPTLIGMLWQPFSTPRNDPDR